METQKAYEEQDPKIVYYMSMEFLMGRTLGNNLINMTVYKDVKEALEEMGLEAIESRSYLDASSITMEWIEQSCCRRPAQGYACPDGEIRELGGMFSCYVDLGGPGIAFTCYGKQEP